MSHRSELWWQVSKNHERIRWGSTAFKSKRLLLFQGSQYLATATDPHRLFVRVSQLRFLETMEKRSNAELRLYEFDADDELPSTVPDLKNTLGAFHVSELFFVFGNEDGPGGNLPLQGGAFGLGLGFTKQDWSSPRRCPIAGALWCATRRCRSGPFSIPRIVPSVSP